MNAATICGGAAAGTCTNSPSGLYTCSCKDGYSKSNAGSLTETCEGKNA